MEIEEENFKFTKEKILQEADNINKMLSLNKPLYKMQRELEESKAKTLSFLEARGFIKLVKVEKEDDKEIKTKDKPQKIKRKGIVNVRKGTVATNTVATSKEKEIEAKTKETHISKLVNQPEPIEDKTHNLFQFIEKLTNGEPMSLLDELDQIPDTKEVEKQTKTQEEEEREAIFDALKKLKGPDEAKVNAWKKEFGGCYIIPFSQTEIFAFTHLTIRDWRAVRDKLQSLRQNNNEIGEEHLKKIVVCKSVLWPKQTDETIESLKAGELESLYVAIMQKSDFLNESQVARLTFVM